MTTVWYICCILSCTTASLQLWCVGYRLLQSSKLAASELGYNRAVSASATEAEETAVAENDNDDDDNGDEDDDESVERNGDYDGDEEDKADLSDSVESGL